MSDVNEAGALAPVSYWLSATFLIGCLAAVTFFTLALDGPAQVALPLSLIVPVTVSILDIRARRRWNRVKATR